MQSSVSTRSWRAAMALAIALVTAAMLTCIAPAGQAQAITLENAKGTIHFYLQTTYPTVEMIYSKNKSSTATPKKVKSSKKSVCAADGSGGAIYLYPEKPGKTTLTYKWKGKKHKVKIVFHKWTNPVSSFTIGGKQYAGKLAKKDWYSWGKSYIHGKVKVTAKKGWKIKSIMRIKQNLMEHKVKNGSTVKKSQKAGCVSVSMVNKKSGQEVNVVIARNGFFMPN